MNHFFLKSFGFRRMSWPRLSVEKETLDPTTLSRGLSIDKLNPTFRIHVRGRRVNHHR